MKKITLIALLAAGLMVAQEGKAQLKIGYISLGEVVTAMPEFKKADTSLREYQEAMQQKYFEMINDFNNKDSLLSSADTLKYNKAQLEVKRKELGELYLKIQGWNQEASKSIQQKEEDLIAPIQKKAMDAIQAVAKEAGYTYVLNKQDLFVFPPADDLLPLVKKKLNLK
ncbi:MAG TPA: OmpH family outer membrane protein [Parasegetibacter sp.]